MNSSQKRSLAKICASAALFIAAEVLGGPWPLFVLSYIIVGFGPILSAAKNISRGQIFDENFLMTIATAGALALRQWDEAVAVMLFYAVGELFEDYAVNRSRESINDLMDIRPDHAVRITGGREETVDPYDIRPGDMILVRPGEKIPLDGIITEGASSVDTSALTGESVPLDVCEGMDITSGFVNMSGILKIKVTATFDESTVAKVLDLVENSGSKKASVEKFITRFARYYTPTVVIAAVLLAVLPTLLFGEPCGKWIYRALLFLVISCPCALVISVPLAFFGGVGRASRSGVLVKGSNYLESMANIKEVVFDKTGTLTSGVFDVIGDPDKSLLELAAHIEYYSDHPISNSIKRSWGGEVDKSRLGDAEVLPGKGIRAVVDGIEYYVGGDKLMAQIGVHASESFATPYTSVHIAEKGRYIGTINVADTIKKNAAAAIKDLRTLGIQKTLMLSGDKAEIAGVVSAETGIDEYHSGLLPEDKVTLLEDIMHASNGGVAYVGDGINDAPVLARADVGIAMGGAGSQAALEAADIAIMDDDIAKIPLTIGIARSTARIAKQNVIFALTVKGLVLLLGAIGMANMWMAVFADVGVAVIAILNSMRMLIRQKN